MSKQLANKLAASVRGAKESEAPTNNEVVNAPDEAAKTTDVSTTKETAPLPAAEGHRLEAVLPIIPSRRVWPD